MITISTATFFVSLVEDQAVRGGEPAGPVLNSPNRATLQKRAFSLLPAYVQKLILLRRAARLQRSALQRLAETSPHLLADIGVVQHEITTFDGHHPLKKNTALTCLVRSASPSFAGPFGVAVA